jgi:hypothetical protein
VAGGVAFETHLETSPFHPACARGSTTDILPWMTFTNRGKSSMLESPMTSGIQLRRSPRRVADQSRRMMVLEHYSDRKNAMLA